MDISHLQLLVTIVITFIGSSGFWLYLENKRDTKDLTKKLLMGLAHDRITSLSMHYIIRGYVTQDEYENLELYLVAPYIELGGDGSIKRLKTEVDKLPIKQVNTYEILKKEYEENVHE